MASSFYSNAQHVDFESVLGMDDHGMVSMFEALMASGLRGFLGCPAVVYEDALVDFFENASVRSGVIISTVGGQLVEISEERFAESFELPVDGFGDLSEIPKDAIFDARSIVSLSGEPINLGSADKNGESGRRGLQKPANTQKEGSAVTPSFEQRVQMAQRRIVQTVLDADANRESQDAAERDRERRRKEARSLKRRRKD
ncbi:hypothetical protein F511_32031 [Dorcoceras hygrometricum]|uniref:Dystroglycan-like n=1 Tax=Dorcoceras hygrometricum TaxID=472368 RepID=A0A2Z7BUC9_9LAMI|nr:hypothetical protein F511_32031 [Dorcoceras hygrometricum]